MNHRPDRFRKAVAATIVLGAVAVAGSTGGGPVIAAATDQWQERMDAAAEAESAGEIERAEATLLAAIAEAERPRAAPFLVARSVEALADLYRRAGRRSEAEPLYLRSAALWDRLLGPRQPRVGITLHNLAALYLEDCRVEQALPLTRRVLELWGETLGPGHPERLTAIRTQATLLRRCGRSDEAASLEEQLPAAP